MGRGRRQSNAWAPSSCGNKSPPTRRLETTHRCYLAILEVEAHLVSLGLNHPWARLSSLPDARSPRLVGPFPPPHACSHPASPSCPGPSSPSWQDRCEYIGHQNDPGQAPHRPSLHRHTRKVPLPRGMTTSSQFWGSGRAQFRGPLFLSEWAAPQGRGHFLRPRRASSPHQGHHSPGCLHRCLSPTPALRAHGELCKGHRPFHLRSFLHPPPRP